MNHIDLLKILEDVGVNREFNVSPFMKDNFDFPTYNEETEEENDGLRVAKNFLLDLKELQYIDVNMYQLDEIGDAGEFGEYLQWFGSEFPVNIRLRVKGVEYLHQYRMLKATRWNFASQFFVTFMSMIAAIASFAVAYFTYNYTIAKDRVGQNADKKVQSSAIMTPNIRPSQIPPPASEKAGRAPDPIQLPSSSNSAQKTK